MLDVYSPAPGNREPHGISDRWSPCGAYMPVPMDPGSAKLVLQPSPCPLHAEVCLSQERPERGLSTHIARPHHRGSDAHIRAARHVPSHTVIPAGEAAAGPRDGAGAYGNPREGIEKA